MEVLTLNFPPPCRFRTIESTPRCAALTSSGIYEKYPRHFEKLIKMPSLTLEGGVLLACDVIAARTPKGKRVGSPFSVLLQGRQFCVRWEIV